MTNVNTNNTYTSDKIIENETLNLDHLSKKEIYNQLSFWGKFKYRVNQFLNTIHIIRCICCFTAVFSLIGTLILIFGGSVSVAGFMFAIGFPSAILACPFKFLEIALALVVGGFSIGLCFLGFGCVIGAVIGIIIAFILLMYCPVFVTVPYFFKELRYAR